MFWTYRAAVLDDRVAETGGSLRSQLLAIRTSEDQSFLQKAALLVFVGHHIPAVERDVLMCLCRQKLEKLQLNCNCVPLLFPVSIMELQRGVLLLLLLLFVLFFSTSYSGSSIHVHSKPDGLAGAGTGFCPPGFPGYGCWTGRDAGFSSFHITKDPDGVPGVASVWVDPVLA